MAVFSDSYNRCCNLSGSSANTVSKSGIGVIVENREKISLRKVYYARRNRLTQEFRCANDLNIQAALCTLPLFVSAPVIAGFVSHGAEPDILPALTGKTLLLPRFNVQSGDYEMVPIADRTRDLVPGKFGIPEPRREIPAWSKSEVDSNALFIVPAVACDRQGVRLGHGNGFYDRLTANVVLPLIAVIYSCQVADQLPREAHDRLIQFVVTENFILETN